MASFNLNGKPLEEYQVMDFSGGLNNQYSSSLLENNESTDLLNVSFSEKGTFKKRPGIEIIRTNTLLSTNTTETAPSLPGSKIKQVIRLSHRDGTSTNIVVFDNGQIRGFNQNGIFTVWLYKGTISYNPSGKRFAHFQYQDPDASRSNKAMLFFGNATDGWFLYKEDGSNTAQYQSTIPKCEYGILHRNRAFYANENNQNDRFYWSELFKPETVNMTVNESVWGTQTTATGGGIADITSAVSPITGLQVFQDNIMIFKADGIWALSGRIPDEDYELQRLNISTGCTDPYSLVLANNKLMYKGEGGIYYLTSPHQEFLTATPLSEKITPELKGLTNVHAIYSDNKYYLFSDQKTLVWEESYNSWTKWTFPISFQHAFFDTVAQKIVLSGSNGYLYTLVDERLADETDLDVNIGISSTYSSSIMHFGIPHKTKKFKWAMILFKPNTQNLAKTQLLLEVDYKQQTKEFSTQYDSLLWEDDGNPNEDNTWGEYWGEISEGMSAKVKFSGNGKLLRLTFKNDHIYEELEIHGFVIGFKILDKVR